MEETVQPKNLIHPRFVGWLVGCFFGLFIFLKLVSLSVSPFKEKSNKTKPKPTLPISQNKNLPSFLFKVIGTPL